MTGLRIAQLANFVGATSGGMRVAIENLGRGYVSHGAQRMLIVPSDANTVSEDETGIRVEVKSPRVSSAYRMMVDRRRIEDALRRFAPTSIEVSDKASLTCAARWAKGAGVHSVLLSHERLDDMAANWLHFSFGVVPAIHAWNTILGRLYDDVVVTTRYSAREWPSSVHTRTVNLGVDLVSFRPYQVHHEGLRLCYAGRLSHEKHPQLAICAFQLAYDEGLDAELHIYGTGPDETWLRRLASGYPVVFHGFVEPGRLATDCYSMSDMSLSVSPTETFGLAVLEALACGTPVVTADRGGARELVTQACGRWGEPTPRGIADAIWKLAAIVGPNTRIAARQHAESYDWERAVRKMIAIHRGSAE